MDSTVVASSTLISPDSLSIQWTTWRSWESVAISLRGIPRECNTKDIWDAFHKEGSIVAIDIWDDRHGERSSRGGSDFEDFWTRGPYVIRARSGRIAAISLFIEFNRQPLAVPSPVQLGVFYPAEFELPLVKIDFGIFFGASTFCPLSSFKESASPKLVIDARQRKIFLFFKIPIQVIHTKHKVVTSQLPYRFTIPFFQLSQIWRTASRDAEGISFIANLNSPPIVHRRVLDIQSTVKHDTIWRDGDSWYRQTNVADRPWKQEKQKTSLHQTGQAIDIGRWHVFEMTFPTDIGSDNMQLVYDILKDHNIVFKDDQKVERRYQRPTPVWDWIDTSAAEYNKASSDTDSIGWFEDMLTLDSRQIHLPFSVRYQLEVCISQNILSEFTMTREFLLRLLRMREAAATQLLEQVATCKRAYADPMDIFSITYAKGVTNSKIPAYCCFMRTARITPTTIYYNTPTVDISNRVTRRYREHADRFLRVRFTDEKSRGRIMPTPTSSDDEIFTRVWRTLKNGIMLGDRHYEFLAFGNSQFREHGAYFFASTPHLKASQIRGWMGQFSHIKNVARHAARIGQCFSTTRAVVGCPVEVKKCDEISRNGQCFSDGVGKISRFLAQMTTEELKFQTIAGRYPCAFQFRLGGSKGMLVVSDDPQPKEVHIRPSQDKFPSDHTGLEIIRHSQYSPASLNRQLILVLSSLGIPDAIICKKLRGMLEDLDVAMENHHGAIETLNKLIDPNQITASLAHVLECGFRREKEPFINSVVALWKSWHMKSVKEKARIVINQGASLLGCIDEIGVLKGHFDKKIPRGNASYDERVAALPEIFVQIDLKHKDRADTFQIIEGICIVARNPSLHPGDIRVVRAVNRPELKNLHNVVVFPQTGDQVITSMCSGGDLDGDDYTVIWDQDLIPKDWFVKPMKYTSRKAPDFNGNVTVNEIISFFVTYMKNDSLPRIAHAHMALADRLENGVLEKKCMQLAQLHSDAVDYNKTGAVAIMTRDLEPRLWPHFMEKKHKRPEQIYHSEKILGQLYDAVEVPDYAPNLSLPFDERVLNSPYAPASLKWTELATQLKSEYDAAIRRVMAQYEIQTEFEVWSSFVLGHNQLCRDYNLSEELGRKNSILQDGVRQQCYDKVGSRTMESMAPFVVAAYRVTSEEVKVALQEGANNKGQTKFDDAESVDSEDLDSSPQTPLISFPWIFKDILCQIVQGRIKVQNPDNAELDTGKMYSHADVIAVLDELQKSPESGVIEEGSIWKNVAATGGSDPERDSDPGSKVSDKDLHTGERNDIVEAEDVSKTNLPAVEKLLSLIGETDA